MSHFRQLEKGKYNGGVALLWNLRGRKSRLEAAEATITSICFMSWVNNIEKEAGAEKIEGYYFERIGHLNLVTSVIQWCQNPIARVICFRG